MKNFTKGLFVGSFMLMSALGLSQNPLSQSKNAKSITTHVNQQKFKFSTEDVQDLVVTDEYYSRTTGLTHVYVQQQYKGIPIHNKISSFAMKNNSVFYFGNDFIQDVASKVKTTKPSITAQQAIEKVVSRFKLGTTTNLRSLSAKGNDLVFSKAGVSEKDIPVKLNYVLSPTGELVLSWDVVIDPIEGHDVWSVRVDAATGEIKEENIHNYTISCAFENPNYEDHNHEHNMAETADAEGVDMFKSSNLSMMVDGSSYKVLPLLSDGSTPGIESHSHGRRAVISDPANPDASPFGWHDTNGRAGAEFTITRGNNAHAYLDARSNNQIGFSPEGGRNLDFDFPFSSQQEPAQYRSASMTNLFYGNNMVHDVWYVYGFDEAAGNFQENNYGKGGRGSDYVRAELDIGPFNNANMSTQGDGTNPRMQMYLWNQTRPGRDGNFDSGIVIHEYGHGISTRLAGGPSQAGCLRGREQQGEGWSDWFALMQTMNTGDTSTKRRGIGTYAQGQPTTGGGIRRFPYSTSMNTNPFTYDDIKSQAVPHGVGSVWATILWDLTWAYVDKYGFSTDVYNGDKGNNKVMQLVLDGLKLQPCSSGFVKSRDALLAADKATTGGKDACIIWEVFARRGVGVSATEGSPASNTDGREAFDTPDGGDISISTIKDECGSEIPKIEILNFSSRAVTSVRYAYRVNGGATQNGTWTGNIGACESGEIIIDDLGNLPRGSYLFEIATQNPDGSGSATISINDSGSEEVVNTFENASDELIATDATGTTSLWERGTAAGRVLTNGVAGSKVYGTNLDGTHGNNKTAYLMSQCYDLSDLTDMYLKFDMAFDLEKDYDVVFVEYSKDGGEKWDILGDASAPNWYNSDLEPDGSNTSCSVCVGAQWTDRDAQMKNYQYSLAEFDSRGSREENMLFRFVFKSDGGVEEEGAIIDNFVITGGTLSTDDVEFEGLSFFPNPTKGVVTIKSATSLEDAKISVNDVMGRVLTNVSVNTIGDNKMTVDMSAFATGAYFLTIENDNRKSTRQIIKE